MGLARQLYRTRAKRAYKAFREGWRAETADTGGRLVRDGKEYPCPTFSQWLEMNERARAEARRTSLERAESSSAAEEFSDPKDLEWE